jgi:medium-chain acyl-[acyl-carrier-protein] hydrolase
MLVSGFRAPHLPARNAPLQQLSDIRLRKKLHILGGTPDEILENDELLTLLLPILRADLAICESYVFQPCTPLGCSITAMCGEEDAHVIAEDVVAWREHTRGAFSWYMFPGRHFFLDTSRLAVIHALEEDLGALLCRLGVPWP